MDSKRKETTDKLMEMIKGGDLAEGAQLPPERDLALQLNVSRNLLREAIITLEAFGVLEVRKRQGIFVKEPTLPDFVGNLKNIPFSADDVIPQMMEARILIEGRAAELAAERATDKDIIALEKCFKNLVSAPFKSEAELRTHAYFEFDFHSIIMQASHNMILSRIFEGLISLMERINEMLHLKLAKEEGWINHVISQHEAVLKAVIARDSKTAGEVMRQHIQDSINKLNSTNR